MHGVMSQTRPTLSHASAVETFTPRIAIGGGLRRSAKPRPARRPAGRPASVELTGVASEASRTRSFFHVLFGAFAWISFGALWVWTLTFSVPDRWLEGVLLIAAILLAWTLFTICWVTWNRSIYRRRHRRGDPVELEIEMDEDTLGRPVLGAREARDHEGQIVISVDEEGSKHYRRVGGERSYGNGNGNSIPALLEAAQGLREIVDLLPRPRRYSKSGAR
jgi:hypothetical protein